MIEGMDQIRDLEGLIIFVGPTGVGKSGVAMSLARERGLPIISADSRQIYKGMEIGTDAPSLDDLTQVKHYFVGTLSPDQSYSVADYADEALDVIAYELAERGTALVCGGSYLYIRALLYELDEIPPVPDEIRMKVYNEYQNNGLGSIVDRLAHSDPEYLKRVDANNYRRLLRAYEVLLTTGRPFSSFHTQRNRHFDHPVTVVSVTRERYDLYRRINTRVEEMIKRGLVDEVRNLLVYREFNALNTIGYQEIFRYICGKSSLEDSIDSIKKNSRTFARHQITTFKKLTPKITLHL